MNINSDGAEIDAVRRMQVYGDWIKFTDGEGSDVKITPGCGSRHCCFRTGTRKGI